MYKIPYILLNLGVNSELFLYTWLIAAVDCKLLECVKQPLKQLQPINPNFKTPNWSFESTDMHFYKSLSDICTLPANTICYDCYLILLLFKLNTF